MRLVGMLARRERGDRGHAPGAPTLIRKLFLVSRTELVLLVLIVADMVLKPGL
jgi:hypothetical protein